MPRYHEIVGCLHIHYPLSSPSSGMAFLAREARRAGLDFLITTSHTPKTARSRDRHRRIFAEAGYHGGVLVISGEEVDNETKESHALVLGFDDWLGRKGPFPAVFDRVEREGGMALIAHPDGRHQLFLVPRDHRWREWRVPVRGIEVWSLLFDWARRTHAVNLPFRYAGFPRNLAGPSAYNRRLWDRMALRGPAVGVAGLDIHRVPFPSLDIRRRFEYRTVFKVLRNHLLLRKPLTGDPREDRRRVLECLKRGNLFFANDAVAESRGFFFGSAAGDVPMGGNVPRGARAAVVLPRAAVIRILRNGTIVSEKTAAGDEFTADRPGVYRAEAVLDGRPWIYSNHLRVV